VFEILVGAGFFPSTRFSKSKLVSSIGPREEFSCMGELELFTIPEAGPSS
jgi:hypothetical protein